MNDHSSLLILGGVVFVLAPFVLIGIGIASDYRAVHPNRAYEPHNARNIVLGFVVVIVASVVFARLSHHSQAPTLAPVRAESATGVPFVPVPTTVAATPHAASPGAPAATSPRSTTTTLAVPGSGLLAAFLSALVKGTTVTTAPPGTLVVTTTEPPITTATTRSTPATTHDPRCHDDDIDNAAAVNDDDDQATDDNHYCDNNDDDRACNDDDRACNDDDGHDGAGDDDNRSAVTRPLQQIGQRLGTYLVSGLA